MSDRENPRLSVLVVCRDQAAALSHLLSDLADQSLPAEQFEVIVIDSQSRDGTRAVAEAATAGHGTAQALVHAVLGNPKQFLAHGWNVGIEAARGRAVLRLDAHARIPRTFLAESLAALDGTPEAWAAGGPIRTVGHTFWGRVNAAVLSHPFGVGGSRFRTQRGNGLRAPGGGLSDAGRGDARIGEWVDTVPYAAYHRWVFDRVGLLDERLVRGEDLEFHARIRRAGGRFWLDRSIFSEYGARPTLAGLLRKAWGDGFWNPRAARLAHSAMRPYHFAPPAFVASLVALTALSPVITNWPLAALAALYVGVAGAAARDAAHSAKQSDSATQSIKIPPSVGDLASAGLFPAIWLAFALFHVTRGIAAIAGFVSLFWWDHPDSSASGHADQG